MAPLSAVYGQVNPAEKRLDSSQGLPQLLCHEPSNTTSSHQGPLKEMRLDQLHYRRLFPCLAMCLLLIAEIPVHIEDQEDGFESASQQD